MADRRTVCLVCSTDEFRHVCEKDGYRYVRCAGCGVVRQYPYPTADEMIRYYERYRSHKASTSVYLTDTGFDAFKRDKLLTFGDLGVPEDGFVGKRICDVGCATGQFLELMADRRAAHLFGIDVSDECVHIANSRGLCCVQGDFIEVEERFDVISMWHLVEHLPRPQDFVRHAYRLLVPDGWLLVETPVIGAISDAFGADWRYFMPIEHINLFSEDALFRLCRDAGFALKSWVRFGSGNDSGTVPAANKRAMDSVAKKLGIGDTLAAWFVKDSCPPQPS